MFLIYLYILLSCTKSILTSNDLNVKIKVIADVINSYNTPTSVLSYSCENKQFEIDLSKELNDRNNFIFLQDAKNLKPQDTEDNANNLFIIANLNCPGIRKFLEQSAALNIFRTPYRWLFFDGPKEDDIPTIISDMYFPPESEILYFTHKTTYDNCRIRLIYRVGAEGEWRNEMFGHWNSTHGLQKTITEVTALRRRNLHGYELKVGYIVTDDNTLTHLEDKIDNHIDVLTKANFQTMNFLFDFLNASRKYVFIKSEKYVENITWNGLLGHLAAEDIDIGGTPMLMTSDRLSTVTFVACPLQTRAAFVFQQPSLSYDNNIFLLSFTTSLWFGSAILISLTYLILFIGTVWEWKKMGVDSQTSKESGVLRPNVFDIALLIVGATCQQGSTVELKGASGRIVFLLLFMTITFLYTSFSANIVGLLQSRSTQIKTLQDLLNSGLKFGVEDTEYNRYSFAMETERVRKALYKSKIAPPGKTPNFRTIKEGVKELKKGLFAFHMDTGAGYKVVGKIFSEGEKCGFFEIPYLPPTFPSIAIHKKSAFSEMFKIGLKRIEEHGLQRRENRLLYEKIPKCEGKQASFVTVGMNECSSAFLALLFGMLISILICCIENIIYKFDIIQRLYYAIFLNNENNIY